MSEELNTENTLEAKAEVAPVEPIVEKEAEVEAPAESVESVEDEGEKEVIAPVSSREEIIARLQEMVSDISLAKRPDLESLKQSFYKLQRAAQEEQIAAFVAGGGTAEEFKPEEDPVEEQFRKLLNIIKEKKAAAQEALEIVRKENYKKKLALLDRFKALIEKANTEGASYNEFKTILQEWKEIKEVPADKANELWKAYQQYAEQFYDIQKLNNEFREYDFKKNMEAKIAICEEAEKLADDPDIVSAFRKLQKLHQDYRETGPVSKESREEIWTRFKTASTVINKRHQQHFEQLKEKEKENLDQKIVICELIEGVEFDKLTTFQQWNEKTQEVLALQKKWKDIGFAPAKQNQKIFERFRTACDKFFSLKGEFFKQAKDDMTGNLEKKTALCEQAEALKDSTDWKATGEKMAELQKQWREIGPVQKKFTKSIWKRFIGACDYFYEQRDKNTSSKKHEENANLAAKKEIIAKLKAFDAANLTDDDIQAIQQLIDEWNGIGFVPFKVKDKIAAEFKAVVDSFGGAVSTKRNRQSQRGGAARDAGSPRERLQRQYEQKKSEIQTYENNLGFMNASSKTGNGFVDAIKAKIETLKKEADDLLAQIKALDAEEIDN